MPQYTFRQPSSSTLDRTQQDPSAADVTPKLRFGWKKDSKLSKDLACLLSGKTAMGPETKTKSKEPDITISIFKGLREMTLYEPNLYRVEMEDFKGLEVVLLLGAQTIRDVWFSSVKDAFKIAHDAPKLVPKTTQNAVSGQKPVAAGQRTSPTTTTSPAAAAAAAAMPNGHKPQPAPVASGAINTNSRPAPERPRITIPQRESKPLPQIQPTPPPGPSEADIEHRRQRKQKEADEKSRRKQQAEVEKETKRLQKIYGREEEQVRKQRPSPAHSRSQPHPQWQAQQRPPQPQRPVQPPRPHLPPRPGPGPGPYLHVPAPHARHSSVQFLPVQQPQQMRPQSTGARPPALQQKKSSFFGFRKTSDDKDKLHKKRSSMF